MHEIHVTEGAAVDETDRGGLRAVPSRELQTDHVSSSATMPSCVSRRQTPENLPFSSHSSQRSAPGGFAVRVTATPAALTQHLRLGVRARSG